MLTLGGASTRLRLLDRSEGGVSLAGDVAAGTGAVFHDGLLSPGFRELLRERTGHHILPASRHTGHHQADHLAGITLRQGARGEACKSDRGNADADSHAFLHGCR